MHIVMPIFQDANGLAIKFFIQKDIAQEIQAELCEVVASLGGRVEAKVPRQGYVLVQPGTAEEERLRLCWMAQDRPQRHFVPYTYVEACKIAGMQLKQIFVENGLPVKMHIHPSIANINARTTLSQRIMHSGGDPTSSPQSAKIILADPNTEVFQHLVKTYQGIPDKHVESYLWVKKCVEKGSLVYTPLIYKNPGGRRPGEERTPFTEDDEQRLCEWIAAKIPYKQTGGRTGNRLYQQLCEMIADPEYAWVSRHTWQSWRERYKKNAVRLDTMIAQIVDQKKPIPGEQGQYGYVRQDEEKNKRPRRKRAKPAEQNLHKEEMIIGGINGNGAEVPVIVFDASPVDSGPSTSRAFVRSTPAEEELEDGEDSEEWAVRVGNEPPPKWGKRPASEESEAQHPRKRMKSNDTDSIQGSLLDPGVHLIDRTLQEIATEYRFTLEEVKEFYDQCGEMERTKTRFQKMRQILSNIGES
ncbi:uncharacterized protein BJ212DRAFT_1318173 [Suillus subaureus]|uniref:DNA-binding protein RAP1 n=1 Tax=Suillus subaureus TaxID=48587 RepID=A0A9P7EMS6_9AGAM|nr:uncharacterized protein BJ212DRAFT_1318173 [Suillus subaureus]KAG1826127.1 hypothetical protein BJ212DRAFT_1318173 [Suillus subaureus]